MKVYTVVLHMELTQNEDDPALWNWHELLDLAPDESATVDEIFDEKVSPTTLAVLCGEDFMAGAICVLPEGHSGGHRSGE